MPILANRSGLHVSRIVLVAVFVFIASALVEESEQLISPSTPAESLCLRRCRLRTEKRSNTKVRFTYSLVRLDSHTVLQYVSLKSSCRLIFINLRKAMILRNNLRGPKFSETVIELRRRKQKHSRNRQVSSHSIFNRWNWIIRGRSRRYYNGPLKMYWRERTKRIVVFTRFYYFVQKIALKALLGNP